MLQSTRWVHLLRLQRSLPRARLAAGSPGVTPLRTGVQLWARVRWRHRSDAGGLHRVHGVGVFVARQVPEGHEQDGEPGLR